MKKSGFYTDFISTEFELFNTITFRQDSKSQKMMPDDKKKRKKQIQEIRGTKQIR